MEKKDLKMYEAPEVVFVETETEGFLCGSTNAEGYEEDPIEEG